MTKKERESGQMLLITLLILAVATTIALSLIGRTTIDTKMTVQVEDSSRAFSAAEAGIENALKQMGVPAPQTFSGSQATYEVTQSILGESGWYAPSQPTSKGDTETIWLVDHDPTTHEPLLNNKVYLANDIKVCWHDSTSGSDALTPAVVGTLYYKDGSDYKTAKFALDKNAAGRLPANNFDSVLGTDNCGDTDSSHAINTSKIINLYSDLGLPGTANPIMLRLRLLYATSANFAVAGVGLPTQGFKFESCGYAAGPSGTSGSRVTRCITAYQQYKAPLGIFDYAVYADSGSFSPSSP
jgi:Tfp pilus assembly protein PilX